MLEELKDSALARSAPIPVHSAEVSHQIGTYVLTCRHVPLLRHHFAVKVSIFTRDRDQDRDTRIFANSFPSVFFGVSISSIMTSLIGGSLSR